MISWIQRVTQRHNRILFSILLVVIIVAFVFTIGNTGGFGSGNQQDVKRDFYGFNLNSPRDMGALQQWSAMSMLMMNRNVSQSTLEISMLQRATLLHLADELKVPEPTQAQLADFIRNVPAFLNPETGQFSPDQYTRVVDQIENQPNVSPELLPTVLNQDYRIGVVMKALAGPGYVLPQMAKQEIKRQNTDYSVDIATFGKDTFKPKIDATQLNLEEFYQQNQFRYQAPEQVVLSYAQFPASEYASQVKAPTHKQLESYYMANIDAWPTLENGQTAPLDSIKAEVTKDWKHQESLDLAAKAANELAIKTYDAVYNDQLKANPESIDRFFKVEEIAPQRVAAFSPENIPSDTGVNPEVLEQASLAFNNGRFYSDGVISNNDAYIFFLEETIPPQQLPYDQVKPEVLADYKKMETEKQYNMQAVQNRTTLQDGVKEGKNFQELAQSLGMQVTKFDTFKLNNPPQGVDYFVLSKLREMHQGEVSDLMSFGNLGTYIYVSNQNVPNAEPSSQQVSAVTNKLQAYSAQATVQSTLNELVMVGEQNATPHEF